MAMSWNEDITVPISINTGSGDSNRSLVFEVCREWFAGREAVDQVETEDRLVVGHHVPCVPDHDHGEVLVLLDVAGGDRADLPLNPRRLGKVCPVLPPEAVDEALGQRVGHYDVQLAVEQQHLQQKRIMWI